MLLTRLAAVSLVAAYWLSGAPPAIVWLAAGTVLALLGQGLRLWAAGHLVKQDALTTTGPFAHVRHPLYWGSMLSGIGLCVATRFWWSYLLVAGVFTLVYVPTLIEEERWLLAAYGDGYRRYRDAVPRFGLRLSGYQAAEAASSEASGFSWRRAMDNGEHQTVLATALLLAALWVRVPVAGIVLQAFVAVGA